MEKASGHRGAQHQGQGREPPQTVRRKGVRKDVRKERSRVNSRKVKSVYWI